MGRGLFSENKSMDTYVTTKWQDMEFLYISVIFIFQNIPLYVFGQSYGGKMGVVFAQYIYEVGTLYEQ